ncbi:MAG: hypothetical protein M1453_08350 [Acidobacteria bacterium]|nr:hypothetical protein [Acidobacteriota bacterium]MCL5287985.1 hypothetical protein [Acidobacteriota bacterium]
MSFDEALEVLSRDERFRATVYAMNTLLIGKGIYSTEEFERLFCEHAQNVMRRALDSELESLRAAVSANRGAVA